MRLIRVQKEGEDASAMQEKITEKLAETDAPQLVEAPAETTSMPVFVSRPLDIVVDQASKSGSSADISETEIGYESSRILWTYIWLGFIGMQIGLGIWLTYLCETVPNFFKFAGYPGAILLSLVGVACLARVIYMRMQKTPPVWIKLTPRSIHFAPVWNIEILNRREREWSDVRAIYLTGFEGTKFLSRIKWSSLNYATATPQLQIIFQSGGSAHIKLPLLRREQAAELLTSISQFVQSKILSSDVVKLKEALLCESSNSTYTELWAQDLEMRHGSTHFAPLSAGSTLADGRYKVLSELGTGGLSAIYLVESQDGRKLILKESVLPLDMQEQAKNKAREMFRREALILMKLSHPQIAKILDQFVQDGRDYMVSEFISGKTLRQLVAKEGRRAEKDVLGWAREIADILVYLHHQSPPVVHRDVTPDNILLRDDGTLVLIDFGAANEYLGAATGTMVGKQAYIPPEQLRGKYEPASDLYGLGATMYFLLTGKDPLPLDCSHPKEVVASLSDQIDALVATATELEVEDRVLTAEIMLEKIRSLFA